MLKPGEEAMFALSMLSTNFPSIHLRLEFPDGEPGTWETGKNLYGCRKRDGARLSVPVPKALFHTFPENPGYAHPAGRITGMNPVLLGRLKAE